MWAAIKARLRRTPASEPAESAASSAPVAPPSSAPPTSRTDPSSSEDALFTEGLLSQAENTGSTRNPPQARHDIGESGDDAEVVGR